jgi:hypothetical protein
MTGPGAEMGRWPTAQALRRFAGLDVHIVRDRDALGRGTPARQLPRPPIPARNPLRPARAGAAALTGLLARVRRALRPRATLALMVDRMPKGGQLSRVAAASVGEQPAGAAHSPRRR